MFTMTKGLEKWVKDEIYRMEVEIEEEYLKILTLHPPVAIDLRFSVAVLKINNDLERIADNAANLAKCTLYLGSEKRITIVPKCQSA